MVDLVLYRILLFRLYEDIFMAAMRSENAANK